MQIILAEDYRSRLPQPPNHVRILVWNAVLIQRTGRSGADPRGVDKILQCNRYAMQRPAPLPASNLSGCIPRLRQGGFSHDRNKRVECRIQSFDPLQAFLCNFNRRDLSPPQPLRQFGNSCQGTRHRAEPIVKVECRPPCALLWFRFCLQTRPRVPVIQKSYN